MIIVHGSVTVPEEHLEKALTLSQEHVTRSRAEPGCIEHGVYLDPSVEGRLIFVEKWKDDASLKQHFALPDSITFVQAISAIACVAPDITIFKASEIQF